VVCLLTGVVKVVCYSASYYAAFFSPEVKSSILNPQRKMPMISQNEESHFRGGARLRRAVLAEKHSIKK
jgi:hypothetical protein